MTNRLSQLPLVLLALLLALSVVTPQWACADEPLTPTFPDFGLDGQASLPNCATLPDGRVVCAFMFRPAHGSSEIRISVTSDAGRTWSPAVRVMPCPGAGYIADPNVLVAPWGVTVFATFVPHQPDGTFATSKFLASTSSDDLKTWSPPTEVPVPHRYISGKVHVPAWVGDGGRTVVMGYSWDIPADTGHPAAEERAMYSRAGVLVSHDAGRTWVTGGETFVNDWPTGADEPAVVSLGGQDLFMVVRTATPRPYESFSHDGGATWSTPRPGNCFAYNSPAALLRLEDGSVLRVWDNSPRDRFPLVAAISRDGCRTWSTPRVIATPEIGSDGKPSYDYACYPSAARAKDGAVVLAWWQEKHGVSSVGVTTLTPQWLKETAGQEASVRAPRDRGAGGATTQEAWETHEGVPLPLGRGSHAGGVVDRRVVVAGGTSWSADRTTKTFLRSSIWFDAGIWRDGPPLPVPMAEGAYASDGRSLYLAGGYSAPDVATDVACRITAGGNGADLGCEKLSPLPHPIAGSGGAMLDGTFYVAGGYVDGKQVADVMALETTRKDASWQPRHPFPGAARAYAALVPCGGRLYLLGGLASTATIGKLNPLRDAYRYDPSSDQWQRLPDLPVPGYCWSGQAVDDGRRILLVGRADGTIHRDAWLIDVSGGAAKQVAESVTQTTCAPLVRAVKDEEFWQLGGEPDSNKTRTPRVTVFCRAPVGQSPATRP